MKILTLILLFVTPLTLLAQEEEQKPLSHHALGLSASMLSGPGLSYELIFNDDHRIKITGFGYYEKQQEGTSDMTAIIGGEYQYTATSNRNIRFFIEIGGYYWHEGNTYGSYTYPENQYYTYSNDYNTFTGGAGIGVEVAIERHFLISIDGSLLYRKQKRDYTGNDSYYYDSNPVEYFGPGIGISAYYRF